MSEKYQKDVKQVSKGYQMLSRQVLLYSSPLFLILFLYCGRYFGILQHFHWLSECFLTFYRNYQIIKFILLNLMLSSIRYSFFSLLLLLLPYMSLFNYSYLIDFPYVFFLPHLLYIDKLPQLAHRFYFFISLASILHPPQAKF